MRHVSHLVSTRSSAILLSARGERGRLVNGGQLRPGDHRVVEPVAAGTEPLSPSERVDVDIGIDEDVSHDPIHRG